ncbi:MAG: MBL fold metallo-hydrolase [Terriglobia bacterium]
MADSKWKVDVLLQGNWRGASSVLLTNGRSPVLVDTGMPHDAHQLVKALEERRLRTRDIHFIINTHFHFDHVSNNSLFPQSVIYATQQSHDWCQALYADLADSARWKTRLLHYYPEICQFEKAEDTMSKLRKIALRWWDVKRIGSPSQFRWLEKHALPDGIEALFTTGHVPGHASLVIRNCATRTLVAGDALLTRTHDDRVLTMIPFSRAQYRRDREQLLSISGWIIPGHDEPFINKITCP